MKRIILIVFSVLVITGCGVKSNLVKPQDVVAKSSGIILVSVTKVGDGDAIFYYRKQGEKKEKSMAPKIYESYPSRDGAEGQLLALHVEPGKYQVSDWVLYIFRYPLEKFIRPEGVADHFAIVV